jgi:hypothetical protein
MVQVGGLDCSNVAIVLARYLLLLAPICLLWTAIGFQQLFGMIWEKIGRKTPGEGLCWISGMLLLVIGSLVSSSPLMESYKGINNFTNHSAFQESYAAQSRDLPYRSKMFPQTAGTQPPEQSAFYSMLPEETDCLIEYPMMLGDHFNLYYHYQQQHQKRVVAGYSDAVLYMRQGEASGVYGEYFINHVTREIKDKSQLQFRNMVSIFDPVAVHRTQADYLIVHRNLMREFHLGALHPAVAETPDLINCLRQLRLLYGDPVHTDPFIFVFDLHKKQETTKL